MTTITVMTMMMMASVREYVFYVFFSNLKKNDFLRFFEMTFQKNLKVKKVSSLLNVY